MHNQSMEQNGGVVYLGHAENNSAYGFLVFQFGINEIHANEIIEIRKAKFFEDLFPYKRDTKSNAKKRILEVASRSEQAQEDQNEIIDEPRRNKRAKASKSSGPNFLIFMLEGET